MDNRSRSVHTKQLAKCEKSPTSVHYWIQSIDDSPIFFCKYCGGFRAFNVKAYRFNPYCGDKFMRIFDLEELPYLIRLLHTRHLDVKEIEQNPIIPNKSQALGNKLSNKSNKRKAKERGEFDDGPKVAKPPARRLKRRVIDGVVNYSFV